MMESINIALGHWLRIGILFSTPFCAVLTIDHRVSCTKKSQNLHQRKILK